MDKNSYNTIRQKIDEELIEQLQKFIDDTNSGTDTNNKYKDEEEFRMALHKAKNEVNGLFDEKNVSKPTWKGLLNMNTHIFN